MWGNRLGWGISAVLCLFMFGFMFLLVSANWTTPPTAFGTSAATSAIELPVDPRSIVAASDSDCDAGAAYREAIAAYTSNQRAYEQFLRKPTAGGAKQLRAVEILVDVRHCARGDVFRGSPGEVVGYERDRPKLEALERVGEAAIMAAVAERKAGNNDRAKELLEGAFALGAKLYEERLTYTELSAGLGLMSGAARMMKDLPGDEARAEQLQAFISEYLSYNKERLTPVWTVISSIDQRIIDAHTGDIVVLATDGKDHLWRTEATLKLGRHRFNTRTAADQRQAMRVLHQLLEDPDPAVRTAARKAIDLTQIEYRGLGN